MEIQHATLSQVRTGRNGTRVLIEQDVQDVVQRLKELDPNLRVHWNEYGEYFVISELLPDGSESLVTTVQDLNPVLVDYVRKLANKDYAAELDRLDREADRQADHERSEKVGEIGERAAHALRKDLSVQNRIYVP